MMQLRKWCFVRVGVIFINLVLMFAGCGTSSSVSLPSVGAQCSVAKVAEILVGDGYFVNLCGCVGPNEAAGTVYSGSAVHSCHLSTADTSVVFYFGSTGLPHQIVSVGAPSFVPTSLQEAGSLMMNSYAISFNQAAVAYRFRDIFTGFQGQIFVPSL